ncbi:hypothetical protein QFW96_27295 [Saccharopolyspora sp. TS4A08]|uniref:Uncharacterized protein n=2 Tax=Saccharopolyspora TaxID=1835 RepID=A0A1I6TCS8_9PSEU|nr:MULTISPECIES: hypothetical protein [Saccharopolyspora]MDI2032355.1 hypothetical protein [Saccharopolyspora sp. TS4A08]SFS86986.1 hypothetical protein SAMN05660874_03883 [Saccharopolyspora flava]
MWWKILGGLLALWLVMSVAGFLIKGLFWLAVIGGVLFLATAAIGWSKDKKQIKP